MKFRVKSVGKSVIGPALARETSGRRAPDTPHAFNSVFLSQTYYPEDVGEIVAQTNMPVCELVARACLVGENLVSCFDAWKLEQSLMESAQWGQLTVDIAPPLARVSTRRIRVCLSLGATDNPVITTASSGLPRADKGRRDKQPCIVVGQWTMKRQQEGNDEIASPSSFSLRRETSDMITV